MADTVADLALAIEALVPAAAYRGVTRDNSREAFAALVWTDKRPQPSWAEIEAADAAVTAAREAEADRAAALEAEPDRADLADRLATATPAQIGSWVDNNVTSLAEARRVLKAMLKVMAQLLRANG